MTGRPRAPVGLSRRRAVVAGAALAAAIAGLYLLLPRLAGVDDTWRRLGDGDPWWLSAGVALEAASFASYVAVFRAVFAGRGGRVGWRESYLVSLAGVAATRVLAAGGAGGIVLTVWALRRSGMPRRQVLAGMTAFLVLL
jgi:uncharacterized membrane protein YbhN (UPF0104 family)